MNANATLVMLASAPSTRRTQAIAYKVRQIADELDVSVDLKERAVTFALDCYHIDNDSAVRAIIRGERWLKAMTSN